MSIEKIEIKIFKAFIDLSIEFSEGCNIIIGENATGKTQLLNLLLDSNANGQMRIDKQVYITKTEAEVVYIPVKDMLTHSKGLIAMHDKYKQFPFENDLIEIVRVAQRWELKKTPGIARKIAPKLENMMEGTVVFKDDEFFIQKKTGKLINFKDEAEGYKKIGLLWQLLMNESITSKTVLLWDEPEANLNPKFMPDLVEVLLELSRNGVQIFLATHSYILAKYFDVRKTLKDSIAFHALFKTEHDEILCESAANFKDIKHNAIMESFDKLLDEVYDLNVGE